MGGSGDYFDVAGLVIMMEVYRPFFVTGRARQIAGEMPIRRQPEGGGAFGRIRQRVPLKQGFRPERGHRTRVDAKGLHTIVFGDTAIDLGFLEQLVDASQTRAMADLILHLSRHYIDGQRPVSQLIRAVYKELEEKSLDVISPFHGQHPGDYAMPRMQEVAGAINRLRTLVRQGGGDQAGLSLPAGAGLAAGTGRADVPVGTGAGAPSGQGEKAQAGERRPFTEIGPARRKRQDDYRPIRLGRFTYSHAAFRTYYPQQINGDNL